MSHKTGFELDKKGVRELLKSDEMVNCLQGYADQVRQVAGNGYRTNRYYGKNRPNVEIYASTKKAKSDNAKNNTLLKALGSARG